MKEARYIALLLAGALAAPAFARTQSAPPPPGQPALPPIPEAQRPGPIVPDSQFEQALPPLDPALNQPLEPIDPNAPPFPPVPGPVENPPPGDASLTEPLPPLASFDVQPPPAAPGAQGQANEPPPVRYTLTVVGLEEIGLEGRFRGLSALDDAEGSAVNGAMVQARTEEDKAMAVRLLRSEGYYDAVATSAIEQLPNQPGQLRVTITVAPGGRYNLGTIAINGPDTEPPGMVRRYLPLETGHPIEPAGDDGKDETSDGEE